MILETKDQGLINYIFSLPNRTEFEVVEELQSPPALQENKKTILPEKHPDNFVEISKKKKYRFYLISLKMIQSRFLS